MDYVEKHYKMCGIKGLVIHIIIPTNLNLSTGYNKASKAIEKCKASSYRHMHLYTKWPAEKQHKYNEY